MKGISLISGVLFLAFIVVATTIVYITAIPIIERIRCAIAMDKAKDTFVLLDETIRKVMSEGVGSKRTIDVNLGEGTIIVDPNRDLIYWEYECKTPILSPRTFQTLGNLLIGADLDVSAKEGTCGGKSAYILENEHLKVCLLKVGSPQNLTYYNISDVLISVYQKDLGEYVPIERLEITLDDNKTSESGYGYTNLVKSGEFLPYGEVKAYLESDYGLTYTISFSLESGGDFIIIKGE